jgi:Concanavalin A-like lectin/glucanases superfamily
MTGMAAVPYAATVLAAHPVGYWSFDDPRTSRLARPSAGRVNGLYEESPAVVRGISGRARRFDGSSSYVSIANRPAWSETTTGDLTVEFWMRPDRLVFTHEEGSGYVWVVAKGDPGQQEWGFRMYGSDNRESPPRANRIAFYAYNPAGGEGAGAYVQKPVVAGRWIYVVGELTRTGVSIYENGVLAQGPPSKATLYADPAFDVTPRAGTAPVRVGTRRSGSFFAGAVDELAIYGRLLTPRQILRHYRAGLAALRAQG